MKEKLTLFLDRWWVLLALVAVFPIYYGIAQNNERSVDYVNNGFFTFWLGGRLTATGGHPYSEAEYVGGHHANGSTWIPNRIFPYPLPLTLLTAPLGMLPIDKAYLLWDVLAQYLTAICILWLALRWDGLNRRLYALFVLAATVLNGNIYLGLMTGTVAALFLVFLTLGLFFLEKRQPVLAGMALALMALKPPLLTVVILIGVWFLFRREWRALGGIALGGLLLLVIGWLQDPQWVQKFLGAGNNLLSMRVGNQPTLLSYTRLACTGNMTCAMAFYIVIVLALISVFAWLVWSNRDRLSQIAAFSAAIALGVLLPPYVWSYDYALLVIPICYVVFELIRRYESYIQATAFLIVFDAVSIVGLILFWMNPESAALTIQRDMWSIWVGVLMLLLTGWMVFRVPQTPKSENRL